MLRNDASEFYHSLYEVTTSLIKMVDMKLQRTPLSDSISKEKLSSINILFKKIQQEIEEAASMTGANK